MLTGSEANTARVSSSVSKKVLGALVAHTETLECVGMSGDFPFAASGGIDTKLVVWDLNTLQPRNTLPHDKAVSALRWIPGTAMLYRYVFSRFFRLLSRFNSLFWVFPKLSSRFDSKFRTSNERASRGYQCRCVGGQQFAILKNGRLLRCIANPIRV
jgi:WD40 repeat protein